MQRPILWLKKGEHKRLVSGHLWVFSNEVDTVRSPLSGFQPGDEAVVRSAAGEPLGLALAHPGTLLAARLVSRDPDAVLDAGFFTRALSRCLALRERFFPEPHYRLCFGEGDGLPGLVVDRFGDVLSVQLLTAGMDKRRDMILEALARLVSPRAVVFKNDSPARKLEGLPLGVETALGDAPEFVTARENGLSFTAPLLKGQKTGWYFDQRANRLAMARLSRGMTFLDACSYVGGFGVTALAHGASDVLCLDASGQALEQAERNAAQVQAVGKGAFATLESDVFLGLKSLAREGRRFDVVVLDPPAFAKRKKDVEPAREAYQRLTRLGLRVTRPGGFLLVCSCSQHMGADMLTNVLAKAAARQGVFARLLATWYQDADHPRQASMPETLYLKALLASVGPGRHEEQGADGEGAEAGNA